MKKILLLVIVSTFVVSCSSVKKYNQRLNTPISPQKLCQDIDYTRMNLEKYHPELFLYISRKDLEGKFDSLKKSITSEQTPVKFYKRLQPVVSQIREGHLHFRYPARKYSRKEMKVLGNQKGILSRFEYAVKGDSLFVITIKDSLERIKPGSQILEINGQKIDSLLIEYKTYFASDGFNSTFHKYVLANNWANYFTFNNEISDSLNILYEYDNKKKTVTLHREKLESAEKKKMKLTQHWIQKTDTLHIRNYNKATGSFNREFKFLDKDNSSAYMKIKTFSGVRSSNFYKNCFQKLAQKKSQNLVIDIRDNLGGSLAEIKELYSYLATDTFTFVKPVEVAYSTSLRKADFIRFFPGATKILGGIFYPIYYLTSSQGKLAGDNRYYLNNKKFEHLKPKKLAFKGKVYLLVNGSSFSASAILASKIKGDRRGIIVGEETGGANDGTVAGRYHTVVLPNSKLILPIGLMYIRAAIQPANTKKGVVPDQVILPSMEDLSKKKDIQLDWILENVKKQN